MKYSLNSLKSVHLERNYVVINKNRWNLSMQDFATLASVLHSQLMNLSVHPRIYVYAHAHTHTFMYMVYSLRGGLVCTQGYVVDSIILMSHGIRKP